MWTWLETCLLQRRYRSCKDTQKHQYHILNLSLYLGVHMTTMRLFHVRCLDKSLTICVLPRVDQTGQNRWPGLALADHGFEDLMAWTTPPTLPIPLHLIDRSFASSIDSHSARSSYGCTITYLAFQLPQILHQPCPGLLAQTRSQPTTTMVAHLHPRSRSTLSLFTTCLTISFLVVGAPHILPCPVDRRQFAEDGTGEPRKRRRRKITAETESTGEADMVAEDMAGLERQRACPVPKPTGLIGQVMGFEQKEKEKSTTVLVKSLRERRNGELE